MQFKCIEDCAECCIQREYYPETKFGKIGVLILPDEKQKIEKLANKKEIKVNIIPRIGVSSDKNEEPKILAYQMMGREKNGNMCPFLNVETQNKAPNGGYPCKIYEDRPLACRAYPLIQIKPISLDQKCKFCKEHGSADESLELEIESLIKIQSKMKTNVQYIWRYATGIGEREDKYKIKKGWILENE